MAISKPQQFLTTINNCRTIAAIKEKTEQERNYLSMHYNTISSLKSAFTIYRNYLRSNLSPQKKKNKQPVLSTILNELRLTEKQQATFNRSKHLEIKASKSALRQLYNSKQYIDKAITLLDSTSYLDRILALSALTGRRVAEIGCTASFTFIAHNKLLFDGQLKTKDREDTAAYEIPALYNSAKLIQALNALRQQKPQFIDKPQLFHNATSKQLSHRVKQHFSGLLEGAPKVKDLRAIYALLTYTTFTYQGANRRVDRDVYFSRVLGHSKNDLTTCASYVDFYLDS